MKENVYFSVRVQKKVELHVDYFVNHHNFLQRAESQIICSECGN